MTTNADVRCSNCRQLGIECRPHVRKRRKDALSTSFSRPLHAPNDRHGDQYSRMLINDGASSVEPSYLGRSDYLDTHVLVDEEDASQYPSSAIKISASTPVLTLGASALADMMSQSIRESLVSSFTRKCLPWMPVISIHRLRTIFEGIESKTQPTFLILAILTAGSKVSTAPRAIEIGEQCYQRAKDMFYQGKERNTVDMIIATVFLQWWNQSGPEHISIDNSSFWLRIGVALAHQSGLHKEPHYRDPQSALRRKLWWTLVSRDNQIATSHGRPRAINPQDSNMRPLDARDFDPPDEDALLFINFVQIVRIIADLTQASLRGNLNFGRRLEIEVSLRSWLMDLPDVFHLHDRKTRTLRPYTFRSRQLHVPYFVALIILFRQDAPDKCPSGASVLAASYISGIFEEYLDWGDISFVSPASIFYLLVASLLQISAQRFAILATCSEHEVRITNQAIEELKKRFPTAFGAERVINAIRTASTTSSHPARIGLDPHQQDLFNPLGPGLCRQWRVVLGSAEPQQLVDTIAGTFSGEQVTPHEVRQSNHSMRPWQDENDGQDVSELNAYPFVTESDEAVFDAMGQWWWSDLLPDS